MDIKINLEYSSRVYFFNSMKTESHFIKTKINFSTRSYRWYIKYKPDDEEFITTNLFLKISQI